jgi:hypothetical protein
VTITGPNKAPTFAVPRAWMANRQIRMTTAIGITQGSKPGCTVVRPSTAESTEMAGVIMLSP